jgi:hypothetical protein
MCADKIKVGYSLAGFPKRRITKMERFTKPVAPGEPWPKQWLRLTTGSGKVQEVPPDADLSGWTNAARDLEYEGGDE